MRALRRAGIALAFDARYGVRSPRRYPAIAVAAVVTLSLGIGAVTAIFTLLDRTTLRPAAERGARTSGRRGIVRLRGLWPDVVSRGQTRNRHGRPDGAGRRRAPRLRGTLRTAMTPVAIGLVTGTIAAALAAPLARPFLFDVSATDPATLVVAIAVLTGVALGATLVPARRASRVDPIIVLRAE
jgi:ABC-type antimicrobial peptide transport system permease subunit